MNVYEYFRIFGSALAARESRSSQRRGTVSSVEGGVIDCFRDPIFSPCDNYFKVCAPWKNSCGRPCTLVSALKDPCLYIFSKINQNYSSLHVKSTYLRLSRLKVPLAL